MPTVRDMRSAQYTYVFQYVPYLHTAQRIALNMNDTEYKIPPDEIQRQTKFKQKPTMTSKTHAKDFDHFRASHETSKDLVLNGGVVNMKM